MTDCTGDSWSAASGVLCNLPLLPTLIDAHPEFAHITNTNHFSAKLTLPKLALRLLLVHTTLFFSNSNQKRYVIYILL